LPDSTHRLATRRHPSLTWALRCLGALLALAALSPSPARADGDPASDVLASQPMFLPADGGLRQAQAAQLSGLLASAQRQGLPIRVALIATPADLGSVGELWGKPQSYAQFLGQELAQVYRGTVVVVMPSGAGVYHPPAPAHGDSPITVSKAASAPAPPIFQTAVGAVQTLAAHAGHHLALPRAVAAPGSGTALGSVDLGSWLGLAAGAALIALAWTVSLRARPAARLRRGR
jgi:hypothetical protein